MHLSKVQIRNFRNLENISVAFRPGLNALVGRNNVGKTNLFLAIRHALGASDPWDSLRLTEDDIFRESQKARVAKTIRIDLTFSELDKKQLAQFFEILNFNAADPKKSVAEIHFEATWS